MHSKLQNSKIHIFVVHIHTSVSSLVSPWKMLHETISLDFTSVYHSLQLVDVEEILYLKEESMYLSTEFSFLFCILSDLLIRGKAIKKGMKSSLCSCPWFEQKG